MEDGAGPAAVGQLQAHPVSGDGPGDVEVVGQRPGAAYARFLPGNPLLGRWDRDDVGVPVVVGWLVAGGAGQRGQLLVPRLEVERGGQVPADGATPWGDVRFADAETSLEKRMIDVWSSTSEVTYPPLLHGETTIIGTRWPSP